MLRDMQEEKTERKGNKGLALPYFAFGFILFCFFASAVCALQIPLFAFGTNAARNQPALFFTLTALSFCLGVISLLFGIRVFKVKINKFYLILFSVYALGAIIGTLCHGALSSHSGRQGVVIVDDSSFLIRAESICFALLTAFTLFIFFNFFPASRKCRASGHLIVRVFVLIALSTLIYSLIFEWAEYGKALNKGLFSASIVSYLGQKNVYAYYLLIGMFGEIFLLELTERRWRYLLIALFVIAILFTGSKAAILMTVATYIAYLVYRAIRLTKEKRFAWKNAAIPLGTILVFIVGFVVIGIIKPNFFPSLWNAFVSFFKDEGGSNVSSRGAIWSSAVSLTNQSPVYWIFGQGDLFFPYLLSAAMDIPRIGSAHNFVLEMLGRGGVLRLGCFIALFVYVARIYVLRAKKSFRDYFVPLLFAIMMLGRGIVESAFIFDITFPVLAYSYLILMPVLSEDSLVTASEPSEKTFGSAYLIDVLKRYWAPILVGVLALCVGFIPRPYAWIVASSIAIVGLIELLIIFFAKKEKFYELLEDTCCLYLGLIACIAIVALPLDALTVLAAIFLPFLLSLTLRLLLLGLRQPDVLTGGAVEYFYACTLANVDARSHLPESDEK